MVLPRYAGKVLAVKGIKEADQLLRDFAAGITKITAKDFKQLGDLMVQSASARTPIDTGRLVSNNKILKLTDRSLTVGNPTPYAGYVEYGTSRQRAQPYWTPVLHTVGAQFPDMIIKDCKEFYRELRRKNDPK